jgi:D-alanyl-lipoteichoic acid acyltransferase DltB (MBOAT superfamily)
MYFHSLQFLSFLVATFAIYWAVHRNRTARLAVLLLASLGFYAAWSPFPILIFVWCAAATHLAARGMLRWERRPGLRKLLLVLAVASNLGALSVFKYADLFYSTAAALLGRVGVAVRYEPLGLLLPIGLSFVTLQAISLVVDVYRGQVQTRFTYFEHLLYLLFFPQVVAGPIVRAGDLLERFHRTPTLSPEEGAQGLFRIAMGLVKKLVIADVIAAAVVDPIFADPTRFTSAECAIAALGYTLQLYFDFSAYSDVAIGAAALFGFPLRENFDRPYLARNLFEFWNRWHISLSTWLRDYLYIPLGGSRVSKPRLLLNLMAVMVLGGLWHGADWRFALWGGVHGLGLVLTRIWWWLKGKPEEHSLPGALLGWAVTFAVVVFTRIVFRADSVETAVVMFRRIGELSPGLASVGLAGWAAMAAATLLHLLPRRALDVTLRVFVWMPPPLRAAALVGLALGIRQVGAVEIRPYIYFQF